MLIEELHPSSLLEADCVGELLLMPPFSNSAQGSRILLGYISCISEFSLTCSQVWPNGSMSRRQETGQSIYFHWSIPWADWVPAVWKAMPLSGNHLHTSPNLCTPITTSFSPLQQRVVKITYFTSPKVCSNPFELLWPGILFKSAIGQFIWHLFCVGTLADKVTFKKCLLYHELLHLISPPL
jgi:hypothetical protein